MTFIENLSRAFKHKNYRQYFFWQFLSFVGTWTQSTAQSWLVYKLTGSALFLGFVSFAASLPALIFSPLSGLAADHFKRKNVLIVTQALCLVQGIIMIALYFSGHINKWHILYLSVFLGIANSFDVTARQSFIPLLITKNDLLNAIALNSSMFNAARIFGPAIAGILIAAYGEGICFVLNVLSYIPIIIFLILVKAKEQEVRKPASPFEHLKEGLSFAWKNKPIRALLLLVGIISFWGMSFTTLMPIFSDQILHSGSKGLGILMGASGVGAVVGGLFLASRQQVTGIKKIIAFCSVLFSICIFIFSYSKSLFLSMFLLGVTGFCFMIINAGSNTAMQAMSPDYLRGRVIGLYTTMFMGMFPLGSLTIGFLAHHLGTCKAVTVCSCVCFLVGIYFSLQVPKLAKETKSLIDNQDKTEIVIEQIS
ncbi:MAG: MFS transporter [Candidatus Melainabacteria bacterium]|nr:MFS transporter [Candidatus Melainabacteria bacterium]